MVVADDGDIPLFEAAYRSGLIGDEALLHAKASVGTNIAISKILGVQKVSEGFSKKFAKSLANFDNHLLNKDRYKENPNILFCRPNKRHYAIDFGQALLEHRAYEAMIERVGQKLEKVEKTKLYSDFFERLEQFVQRSRELAEGELESDEIRAKILHEANQIRKSKRKKSYNRRERGRRDEEESG